MGQFTDAESLINHGRVAHVSVPLYGASVWGQSAWRPVDDNE